MSVVDSIDRPGPQAICVWLIDDQRLAREGLSRVLPAISPSLDVRAIDNWTVHVRDAEDRPDVAVLNVGSASLMDPGMTGQVAALLASTPEVPLLVVSSQESLGEVQSTLALGARGFFPSSLSLDLLAAAIRLVHAGGVFVPPKAALAFAKALPAPAFDQPQSRARNGSVGPS